VLFLFELSCILHIGTLLLFTVRDFFLNMILPYGSCTNTYFVYFNIVYYDMILPYDSCTNTNFVYFNICIVW